MPGALGLSELPKTTQNHYTAQPTNVWTVTNLFFLYDIPTGNDPKTLNHQLLSQGRTTISYEFRANSTEMLLSCSLKHSNSAFVFGYISHDEGGVCRRP